MPAASIGVDFVANTARFNADIERAKSLMVSNTGQMNNALSNLDRRMGNMGKGAGQMRSGFQQLSFQINDVAAQMANGTKASVIFAQQSGQVIQAIQMMSGGAGKFASFMGGPWGIAISVGVSALSALWSMHQKTEDAAKKDKDAHESFADKLDRTKHSLEEVTQAVRDYNAQQARSREITLQNAQAAAAAASANIEEALSIRQKLAARLAEAQEISARTATGQGGAAGAYFAANNLSSIQQQVAANDAKLKELAVDAGAAVINVAEQLAKINSDPTEKTRVGFDLLRQQARQTITDVDKLAKRLADLNRQEKAALDTQKATRPGNPLGVGPSDVARILGVTPTSATRSVKHNAEVGGATNSFHVSGQAIDFPLGKWSKELIRQTLERAGIRILELLGPGDRGHSDHFHVAFAKTRKSPESILESNQRASEQAAAKAERDREEAVRRARMFADMSAGADKAILDAKMAAVTDAAQLAAFAREQIKVEAEKYQADVQAKVQLGDLTKAQGDELILKNAIAASLKDQKITQDEIKRKADEELRIVSAANDNQRDILGLQEQLATTAEERRKIQLSILALDKEEERRKLQAQARSDDPATRADAANRLGSLDQRYDLRGQSVRNSTAGPLEKYLRDTDPATINERVETLVVSELEAVHQGITDAIAGALGVQDPLLRGLIDMFIEQVLIRPIAQALQNAQGMGGGGGLGGIIGAIGGLFGGGGGSLLNGVSGASFAAGLPGQIANWTPGIIPGFATGTNNAPPGLAWVGEKGPELVKFRGGESVFNRLQLSNMARNDNSGGTYHINVNGAGMSERQARETGAQIQRGIRQEQARNMRMGA